MQANTLYRGNSQPLSSDCMLQAYLSGLSWPRDGFVSNPDLAAFWGRYVSHTVAPSRLDSSGNMVSWLQPAAVASSSADDVGNTHRHL